MTPAERSRDSLVIDALARMECDLDDWVAYHAIAKGLDVQVRVVRRVHEEYMRIIEQIRCLERQIVVLKGMVTEGIIGCVGSPPDAVPRLSQEDYAAAASLVRQSMGGGGLKNSSKPYKAPLSCKP